LLTHRSNRYRSVALDCAPKIGFDELALQMDRGRIDSLYGSLRHRCLMNSREGGHSREEDDQQYRDRGPSPLNPCRDVGSISVRFH
jgi:hypothetical protein